jgi:hypothetical protein
MSALIEGLVDGHARHAFIAQLAHLRTSIATIASTAKRSPDHLWAPGEYWAARAN